MGRKTAAMVTALLLTAFFFAASVYASAEDDLKKANESVRQSIASAEAGNIGQAEKQFKQFYSTWFKIEDGIKEKSKQAYRDIEDTMGEVQFALAQKPVDRDKLLQALQKLSQTNDAFINGEYPEDNGADRPSGGTKHHVGDLVSLLDEALEQLKQNNVQGAKEQIEEFRQLWLDIEGIVLTQSSKVYSDAERDMVTSYALLSSDTPDIKAAEATIRAMRDYLAPLAGKTNYGIFDATTILLREGLEALLVVVALLGFLKKTGNGQKKNWIWFGVGTGIFVSIILGVIVQVLFSAGAFGTNNFLLAGWTGVFASVMLLYMSYWLHSKSSLSSWQQYISSKSTKALAAGNLWSLAILSFLAVFREGTETVLFLIGMASSISLANLLAGIGIGILALVLLSYFILKVGLKIPVRPFFIVSGILVFYLCFKFLGMGIHSLQLAGVLPATHTDLLPTVDLFAIYPTWEGLVPQCVLLVFALLAMMWNRRREMKIRGQISMK